MMTSNDLQSVVLCARKLDNEPFVMAYRQDAWSEEIRSWAMETR